MNEVMEYKKSLSLDQKLLSKKFSMQFLPECLLNVSLQKKIVYKNQSIKTSYIVDIVHNLLLKYYFKKENIFNLSSVILKEKYGHLYNYYMNYLIENNVLILLKKHNKGKNARIYKLNESIIRGEVVRYKNSDSILLKKYKNAVCSVNNKDFNYNLIESEIKSKLIGDLFTVEIDFVKSIFFLDSSIQEHDIYQKNKYSVESIKYKHIFYHFDNYGRLHTNFTILKSFIRKNCLLIDGEETFEIDIKNSQPLFLNKILFNSGEVIDQKEKEFYLFLTYHGKFYKFIQDRFGMKDKKTVKDMTYKVLFGKNYQNKYDKMFSQLFPSIYNFIKKFKRDKGDYRLLSYELQKHESNFLFNKVIKKIMTHHPEIKLLTCHDSLICKYSDREIVSDIFYDLLTKEFDSVTSPLTEFNI
jgi:hypothetical protein